MKVDRLEFQPETSRTTSTRNSPPSTRERGKAAHFQANAVLVEGGVHHAATCLHRAPANSSPNVTCYHRGQQGHRLHQCPVNDAEMQWTDKAWGKVRGEEKGVWNTHTQAPKAKQAKAYTLSSNTAHDGGNRNNGGWICCFSLSSPRSVAQPAPFRITSPSSSRSTACSLRRNTACKARHRAGCNHRRNTQCRARYKNCLKSVPQRDVHLAPQRGVLQATQNSAHPPPQRGVHPDQKHAMHGGYKRHATAAAAWHAARPATRRAGGGAEHRAAAAAQHVP